MTSPKSGSEKTTQTPNPNNTVENREKVTAKLLALEWNTNHPVTGEPIKIKEGDKVTIYRDQFDAMNSEQFRPSWEEVKEEE